MELTCNNCKACTCVDHEGYGKCSQKGNTVVKINNPACDYLLAALDRTYWEDSFGNQYVYDAAQDGFVPCHGGGTFLAAKYMERLRRIDSTRVSR